MKEVFYWVVCGGKRKAEEQSGEGNLGSRGREYRVGENDEAAAKDEEWEKSWCM